MHVHRPCFLPVSGAADQCTNYRPAAPIQRHEDRGPAPARVWRGRGTADRAVARRHNAGPAAPILIRFCLLAGRLSGSLPCPQPRLVVPPRGFPSLRSVRSRSPTPPSGPASRPKNGRCRHYPERTAHAMTTDAITLTDRNDLLSIIPVVLGYHPTNSVVIACLTGQRHQLGPVMRADFPNGDEFTDLLSDMAQHAARHGDDALILLYHRDADTIYDEEIVPLFSVRVLD